MSEFKKTIMYAVAALFISVGFISGDAHAGAGASLTIINLTSPPGISNIEYSGVGASPYPKGCDLEGGAIVSLDDGEEIQCFLNQSGIYAITELNGPFTAEVECNIPITPQIPGVISFTMDIQVPDDVVCTVTNTAIPLQLNSFFPGFSNFLNYISFENGPVNDTVSIYFGFQAAPPFTQFYPAPCDNTPSTLLNPILLATVPSNMFGDGNVNIFIPPLPNGFGVLMQAVNNQHCVPSNAFLQIFKFPL